MDGQLTLPASAAGRWEAYYNFGDMQIFDLPLEKKITQTEWPGIINLIFAVWGAAKAACLLKIPESMPERQKHGDCSDLAKKLRNIAGAATIRATGMKDGKPATESEMRDARDWWWPFPHHARPSNDMLPVEA